MNEIYKEYLNFMKEAKSVYISSIDEYGKPEISYSPCVVDDAKNTYIIVSDLSNRTSSLVQERNVSLMFNEPEDQCKELYVRTRLLFDCSTAQIERLSDKWNEQVAIFLEKFGDSNDRIAFYVSGSGRIGIGTKDPESAFDVRDIGEEYSFYDGH